MGCGATYLCSFPPSTAQKWKFFKTSFDILTIHNDIISYVKHVLDPLCVFFILLGWFFFGGGGVKGATWGTTCSCSFRASAAQKWKFPKLIFFIF